MNKEDTKQAILGFTEFFKGVTGNQDLKIPDDIAKEYEIKPNKWIPCSERLPEIHQDVILSLRSLDIEIGFISETESYFYCHRADGCYVDPKNVLAWMPLPTAYQSEIPTGSEGSEE